MPAKKNCFPGPPTQLARARCPAPSPRRAAHRVVRPRRAVCLSRRRRPPHWTSELYSDALIEAAFTVKALTGLSLRALEGFLAGLCAVAGGKWRVPDYSTLSIRERTLEVDLEAKLAPGKRHVLMVDSTGLKMFGEGEWKVRLHGAERRRT